MCFFRSLSVRYNSELLKSYQQFSSVDESIYTERANHVHRTCKELGLSASLTKNGTSPLESGDHPTAAMYLTVDPVTKVAWSRVAKAGTRSWKSMFLNLTKGEFDRLNIKVKDLYGHEPHLLRSKGYGTFMFSRHPFTRLLSAYRNKFENRTRGKESKFFYKVIGRRIVEKYRSQRDKMRIEKKEPTFKEFVNYVINEDVQNQHWKPVYWLTLPCAYNYTVYGKLETFSEDSDYIIKKFNFKGVEIASRNRGRGEPDPETTYYQQINKEELEALYHIYQLDFLVFDYSYKPFTHYLGGSTLRYQRNVNEKGITQRNRGLGYMKKISQ